MPRPTILACHLTDARMSKLRLLCMRLGLLIKPVTEADFTQPLSVLSGLEAPGEALPAEGSVEEELLVFCHMPDSAVSRFLQLARQQRIPPFALKAVLTPTNAAWTLPRLFRELAEEREALRQGSNAHE